MQTCLVGHHGLVPGWIKYQFDANVTNRRNNGDFLLGVGDQGVPLTGGAASDPGQSEYREFFGKVLLKKRDVSIIVLPGQSMPSDGSGNAIGRQSLQLAITPDVFRRELAAARTFLLEEEAQWLVARGLGTRATRQNVLVFDDNGPMENELRFPDECVRHKTLDLLGDLALTGCDLVGQFVAHRSGHRLNAELVKALLVEEEIVEGRRRSA